MERKNSIDMLRIISAIAVIIIHVVSATVSISTVKIDVSLAINLERIHTLMKWAVPVFFMITGYCLMMKPKCTYEYCFSHVTKYVAVLFTVGLFYALLEKVFTAKTINLLILVQSVKNVISANLWDHMWYVYAAIGIYLIMPVIHCFMQQGKRNIIILTGLLFLFTILLPSVEKWLPVGMTLPFGGYLFYVCFGGAVAKLKFSNKVSYAFYVAGLLSVLWIIFGIRKFDFNYHHLAVCMIAISIFVLVSKIEMKANKLLLCVSGCTWGIYLIHPFFIHFTNRLFRIDFLTSSPYIKLFAFTVAVSLISFVVTYMFRKIPYIKKLF